MTQIYNPDGGIESVVEDPTPQLGGNLDLNNNDITGTGNINITGSGTLSGDLTVDTNTLYVDSTNNQVGIGTTTLAEALTVNGNVEADNFIGGLRGEVQFKAKAGEAITKGDPLYISNFDVTGNVPVVGIADANDANKMPAFGLAENTASLNASINVVTFGTLSGLDTSAFSLGDVLYVSDTGTLTNTRPKTESSLIQNIGKVQRSHATAGSIKVGGAGRTNDVPNLNEGNVFIGDATGCAITRGLTLDDISETATNKHFTASDNTKLDGIEDNADVTDATNVDAAGAVMNSDTSTASMSFVIDEDNMSSNLDTKVPTQQSVKAYVDTEVASAISSEMTFKGGYDATNNLPDLDGSPPGPVVPINVGDFYTVTVAGTFFTVSVEQGDALIANTNNASSVSDWTIVNKNLDAASIKTLYESNSNTNAFTDAEQTKLSGIDSGAIDAKNSFTQNDSQYIATDTIKARDSDGLSLQDDGGNGIKVKDGGYVGIGTTSPSQELHVDGNGYFTSAIGVGQSSPTSNIHLEPTNKSHLIRCIGNYTSTNAQVYMTGFYYGTRLQAGVNSSFYYALHASGLSNDGLYVRTDGRVGVNTTTPRDNFDTEGNIVATSPSGQGTYLGLMKGAGSLPGYPTSNYPTVKTDYANLYFSTNGQYSGYHSLYYGFATPSDETLKENIEPITNALPRVMNLEGVYYEWISDENSERHIGLIAQNVESQFPELVTSGGLSTKAVSYGHVVSVLIPAIQELKNEKDTEIAAIKADYQAKINALTQRVEALEQRLA